MRSYSSLEKGKLERGESRMGKVEALSGNRPIVLTSLSCTCERVPVAYHKKRDLRKSKGKLMPRLYTPPPTPSHIIKNVLLVNLVFPQSVTVLVQSCLIRVISKELREAGLSKGFGFFHRKVCVWCKISEVWQFILF